MVVIPNVSHQSRVIDKGQHCAERSLPKRKHHVAAALLLLRNPRVPVPAAHTRDSQDRGTEAGRRVVWGAGGYVWLRFKKKNFFVLRRLGVCNSMTVLA